MILIVGLGNPGEKFSQTRHNMGFGFLDFLGWKLGGGKFNLEKKWEAEVLEIEEYFLVKPQTFMNNSGRSVAKILNFYKNKFSQKFLVYDDLDIDFGKFKIGEKGPRVHNGVNSVMQNCLGEFVQVRIGIRGIDFDMVKKNMGSVADDYILKEFNKKEKKRLEPIWEKIVQRLIVNS